MSDRLPNEVIKKRRSFFCVLKFLLAVVGCLHGKTGPSTSSPPPLVSCNLALGRSVPPADEPQTL